jgi:formate/nitrite transporter FocA (FNT family)
MPDEEQPAQPEYLKAGYVPERLAAKGQEHLHQSLGPSLVSAALAGGFVTFGALLSVLLSVGVETERVMLLIQGLAFAVGYYFVALTGVALFTEANVSLPDVLLQCGKRPARLTRFWSMTFLFNFLGAFVVGWMVFAAQTYSPATQATLEEIIDAKMAYQEHGGVTGWFAVVLSAMLANWMVGLAFFFAAMAQNVFSKFVPLALAVLLFEAANFQHSPANMAYFSLAMPGGGGPGWADAVLWNIAPAAIGNIIGASCSSLFRSGMPCATAAADTSSNRPGGTDLREHDRPTTLGGAVDLALASGGRSRVLDRMQAQWAHYLPISSRSMIAICLSDFSS